MSTDDGLNRQRRRKTGLSAVRGARRLSERFETLLDEMSGAMSRVPGHEIDGAIEQWLREIVLALDIDRSTVWERVASEVQFVGTHWWGHPENATQSSGDKSFTLGHGKNSRWRDDPVFEHR
jgi:hypothetical protein